VGLCRCAHRGRGLFKLNQVYGELAALANAQAAEAAERAARREHTLAAYQRHSARLAWWLQRQGTAETPLQLAEPTGEIGRTFPPPPPPPRYTLVATDGSQIYPDRHGAALWFVINIGQVFLRYDERSACRLDSVPQLFSDEREVFRGVLGQRQSVTAEDVEVVRTVRELAALYDLAAEARREDPEQPLLALMDGKLIPWSWAQANEGFKLDNLVEYTRLLARFQQLGVPVASYVSRSGANQVINLVRLGDCDQPAVKCQGCPHVEALKAELEVDSMTFTAAEAEKLPCGRPAGLVDADLMGQRLTAGARSEAFVEEIKTAQRVHQRALFFYVHTGAGEIGRVELPEWAGETDGMVDFVHAAVVDQIAKGQGYPVALREAHEQAVVRAPDRAAFIELLERELVRRGSAVRHSLKQRAKERPGV